MEQLLNIKILSFACGFWYLRKELASYTFLRNFVIILFIIISASKLAIFIENWVFGSKIISNIFHISGRTGLSILLAYIYCTFISKSLNSKEVYAVLMASLLGVFIIGKWHCFIIKDSCHGFPTNLPWGVNYNGVVVQPTIFYDILFGILLFILLKYIEIRKRMNYFYLYSLGLFLLGLYGVCIEFLKQTKLIVNLFSLNQICYALLVCLVGYSFIKRKSIAKTSLR